MRRLAHRRGGATFATTGPTKAGRAGLSTRALRDRSPRMRGVAGDQFEPAPANAPANDREIDGRTLAKEPLRAHLLVGGKRTQVPFRGALPAKDAPPPGDYRAITAAALDGALAAAARARAAEIQDLAASPPVAAVTPEDGSVRVAAYHMGFGAADQANERFLEQMAEIGRLEGFRVVVRCTENAAKLLRREVDKGPRSNVSTVTAPTFHDIWSEDGGEVRRDRSVAIPAELPPKMNAQVVMMKARLARFTDQKAPPTDDLAKLFAWARKRCPDACFGFLGKVFTNQTHKSYAALAASAGVPLRQSLSAIEGGNLVVGTDKNGATIAFVGRDSAELTRAILAQETGRAVGEATLRAVLARDLGLPPARVHLVEQPGDYHLDVKLLAIAPGEVVLNDAVSAAQMTAAWWREDHQAKSPKPPARRTGKALERYRAEVKTHAEASEDLERRIRELLAEAKGLARGEARAQKDLEKAGMKVHRVAAVFPEVGGAPANLLNAEQGRGRDGQRFFIGLGADPRVESHWLAALEKLVPGRIARVYFLDRALTASTLQAGGGINCRCKPEASLNRTPKRHSEGNP